MSAIKRAIEFAAAHSADHGIGEAARAELAEMERKISFLQGQVDGLMIQLHPSPYAHNPPEAPTVIKRGRKKK
jgi:hypothetical protein